MAQEKTTRREPEPEEKYMPEGHAISWLYISHGSRKPEHKANREKRRQLIKALNGVLRGLSNGTMTVRASARHWAKARHIVASVHSEIEQFGRNRTD